MQAVLSDPEDFLWHITDITLHVCSDSLLQDSSSQGLPVCRFCKRLFVQRSKLHQLVACNCTYHTVCIVVLVHHGLCRCRVFDKPLYPGDLIVDPAIYIYSNTQLET